MIILLLYQLQLALSYTYCEDIIDQLDCINSNTEKCQWNQYPQECIKAQQNNYGCVSSLNALSCINQETDLEGTLVYCMFSGYCKHATDFYGCESNLSRNSCLSNRTGYCKFQNNLCQNLSEEEKLKKQVFENIEFNESPKVCQQVKGEVQVMHTLDLTSLHLYEELKCVQLDHKLDYLRCDYAGINESACKSIPTESQRCYWESGECKLVDSLNQEDQVRILSSAKCTDSINKWTCLSIINEDQQCKWEDEQCMEYQYKENVNCEEITELVSPSVCANNKWDTLNTQECFHDKYKCSSLCKSLDIIDCEKQSQLCQYDLNKFECKFNTPSQCNISGQNYFSCLITPENCYFLNGQCKQVEDLQSAKCEDGMNFYACMNIETPSQTCIYNKEKLRCEFIQIDQDTKCESQIGLKNANSCRLSTEKRYDQNVYREQGCIWKGTHGCKNLQENENPECGATGLNKYGCLQTEKESCYFDIRKYQCSRIEVLSNVTSCSDLKMVNYHACSQVQKKDGNGEYELCKYDSNFHNCEIFIMDDSIECETLGLNKFGCVSIKNQDLACIWLNNKCQKMSKQQLISIQCQGLANVTSKICALINYDYEICKYDPQHHSCVNTLDSSDNCDTLGLNFYACTSLEDNCYFDMTDNQCKQLTAEIESDISCSYQSKGSCQASKLCFWSELRQECDDLIWDSIQECSLISTEWGCIDYHLDPSEREIQDQQNCIVSNNECAPYSNQQLINCGTSLKINLHTCTGKTALDEECYFDQNDNTCKVVQNEEMLENIKCIQANKLVCLKIRKYQCVWRSEDQQCYEMDKDSDCQDFDGEELLVSEKVCQHINKIGQGCKWEESNKCVRLVDNENGCETKGLNKEGCLLKSNERCIFDQEQMKCLSNANEYIEECSNASNENECIMETNQKCGWNEGTQQCQEISDFSTLKCQPDGLVLNLQSCVSIQYYPCFFNINIQECQLLDPDNLQFNICLSNQKVSKLTCTLMEDDVCKYDYTNHVCQTSNTLLDACDQDITINNQYCESQVNDICTTYQNQCQLRNPDDLSNLLCTQAYNYQTCVAITTIYQYCQWSNNRCRNITDPQDCSTQSNINPNVCMYIQSQEKCQFQSTSTTTGCQVIQSDDQPCLGLNKQACISNTEYPCYYYQNQCIELESQSNVSCNSSLSKLACLALRSDYCIYTDQCNKIESFNPLLNICSTYQDMVSVGVCSGVQANGYYCTYLAQLHQCINLRDYDLSCDTVGLNRLACQERTVGKCGFINGYCQTIQQVELFDCNDYLNEEGCLYINQPCKWDVNEKQCERVVIEDDDECQEYSGDENIKYNKSVCSRIKQGECQYGDKHDCMDVKDNSLECDEDGLNELGCKLSTRGQCEYKDGQCQNMEEIESCDQNVNKYGCIRASDDCCEWDDEDNKCISSMLLNSSCGELNGVSVGCCSRLSRLGIYCKINGNECQEEDVSDYECNDIRVLDSYMCRSLVKQKCYYDDECYEMDEDMDCDEYVLNHQACLLNYYECIWDNDECSYYQNDDDECLNNVSIGQCNNNQQCYFDLQLNKCIKLDVTQPCDSYSQIDNPNICSQIESQPCIYSNQSCIQPSQFNVLTCNNPSANALACQLFTNVYCSYSTHCQDIDFIFLSSCTEIFNQYGCLNQTNLSCYWKDSKCQSYSLTKSCSELPSLSSPKLCYLQSTTPCSQDQNTYSCVPNTQLNLTECDQALSPQACQQIIASTCRYNIRSLVCEQFSFDPQNHQCSDVRYSNPEYCVQVLRESKYCVYDEQIKQCITPNFNTTQCTDYVNKWACLRITTPGQFCIWSNNQCKNTDIDNIECTDLINQNACVSLTQKGQNCKWNYTICANFDIENDINYFLNANACTSIESSALIFDPFHYRCIKPNIEEIDCNSIGLNNLGCLSVINEACIWNDGNCVVYRNDETVSECNEIKNISAQGCALITSNNLRCKFDQEQKQCVDFDVQQDDCDTLGLNYEGCMSVKQQACYWNDERKKCMKQMIYKNVTSCDDENAELRIEIKSNAFSCAQVEYGQEYCKYDNINKTCTSNFNEHADDCDTPGLNLFACTSVTIQKSNCIFLNRSCTFYYAHPNHLCHSLLKVNQNVCQQHLNYNETCKFSIIQRSCIYTSLLDNCNSPGINKHGCLLINNCQWNQDYQKCQCKSSQKQCQEQSTKEKCDKLDYCTFQDDACIRNTCQIIKDKEICYNQHLFTCYWRQDQTCVYAPQCESIQQLDFSRTCPQIQINDLYCQDHPKIPYACQTDSPSCQEQQSEDKCNGLLNGQDCYYINDICRGLDRCQDFNKDLNVDDLQGLCNSSRIKGQQCVWQQINSQQEIFSCTNHICKLMGNSNATCNGKEINSYVCILNKYRCKSCEELDNECDCNEYADLCEFQENKCLSIQCGKIQEEQICESSINKERCRWNKDKQCQQKCIKLTENQCKENDCYWNEVDLLCLDGNAPTINMNPLDDYQLDKSYSQLIWIMIMILLWQ